MTEYLSHHPDIYMARKEMHFFGRDLHFGSQFYRRDRNAYLAEFDAWKGQAQAGGFVGLVFVFAARRRRNQGF